MDLLGGLVSMLATRKGLPSGYSKDLQDDKRAMFKAVDMLLLVLPVLFWLLLPSYSIAMALTWLAPNSFVNFSWDSAGVTTGPITVPLVLAMGLGFGNATHAVEGFGILSMASIGPILTVLVTGLWADYKAKAQARAALEARDVSQLQEVQAIL